MKNVSLFIGLTFGISIPLEVFIIFNGGMDNNIKLVYFLMWVPGFISIFLISMSRGIVKDLGLRFNVRLKKILTAFCVPVFVFLTVFSLLWFFQINTPVEVQRLNRIFSNKLIYMFGFAFIFALGEELGWRGYLQSQLSKTGVKYSFVWIGVIWGLWHMPLILFSNYTSSDYSLFNAVFFVFSVVSASIFMCWLRLVTSSVLLPVITHASHNLWVGGVLPKVMIPGPMDQIFGGEAGLFTALAYLFVGFIVASKINLKSI